MQLFGALAVLVIAIGSIPGLVVFLLKLQYYKPESWETGMFSKRGVIISAVCYFITVILAVVMAATFPPSSKEKPSYKPVQEQLYRRVEP